MLEYNKIQILDEKQTCLWQLTNWNEVEVGVYFKKILKQNRKRIENMAKVSKTKFKMKTKKMNASFKYKLTL